MIASLILPILAAAPKVVCIDPGHPSEVGSGTEGRHISEMAVAWRIALLVKTDLQAKGIKVVMTKMAEHQFVTNRARAEVANRSHADFMLRLHCDSGTGSGYAVYYPDRQGISHGRLGPSPSIIFASKTAAIKFHAVMVKELHEWLKDNGALSDTRTAVGAHQGALTGSVFSKVPVLLVEMVVLQNRKDEAFITSRDGQLKMATALADATLSAIKRE